MMTVSDQSDYEISERLSLLKKWDCLLLANIQSRVTHVY